MCVIKDGISSLTSLLASHWFPVPISGKPSPASGLQEQSSPESPARDLPVVVSASEIEAARNAWLGKTQVKPKAAVKPV